MTLKYPLLRGRDEPGLPHRGGGCLVCGRKLDGGLVYLSAGAVVDVDPDAEVADEPQMEAFFHIGYHSPAADCSGNADVEVVDHLAGGQFDLGFCSTVCLKQFFSDLVLELETRKEKEGEKVKGDIQAS